MNKKELERFEKQQLVDVSKTLNERKQLGQFSTPYSLAEEIADYGLKHLDKEADISGFRLRRLLLRLDGAILWLQTEAHVGL